ncbi:hypothetical protein K458DRAFT_150836 [Lentithecium fluviatile CBS 122367]|uniref:Uncharacterized protein n=1 Tax=Lentithecium fluviatile CBS 122367 TaxID=1168545 RepID=A0A6G1JDM4_9PLEO|nr:hypothetical protein K458DRAFT_150836 [Lentithecium fluviatile CBS 122367]
MDGHSQEASGLCANALCAAPRCFYTSCIPSRRLQRVTLFDTPSTPPLSTPAPSTARQTQLRFAAGSASLTVPRCARPPPIRGCVWPFALFCVLLEARKLHPSLRACPAPAAHPAHGPRTTKLSKQFPR